MQLGVCYYPEQWPEDWWADDAARMVELTVARNPHGRLTTVEDVANALVTLASTDSDWINGNVINVDGGEFITGY